MASSRLEKIGTIFSRTSGLIRCNAMKMEDRPLWYDVYAAFPPPLEPRFDRPAPKISVKQIFYAEDVVRAKYHKLMKNITVNLSDNQNKTQTQLFIEAYNQIKSQGALDDDKIVEVAQDIVRDKLKERYESRRESGRIGESFEVATEEKKET
ncbi:hypothetical protein HA402_000115 [Bradysia odoriphaga]|nr:hypothetical protein HA402_000115 [Bradysia odoriphaga]